MTAEQTGGCVQSPFSRTKNRPVTICTDDLLWLLGRCLLDGKDARERVARIADETRSQLGRTV